MPPSPESGTSEVGQSLPKRDVRVRSVYPSLSDLVSGNHQLMQQNRAFSSFLVSPETIRETLGKHLNRRGSKGQQRHHVFKRPPPRRGVDRGRARPAGALRLCTGPAASPRVAATVSQTMTAGPPDSSITPEPSCA